MLFGAVLALVANALAVIVVARLLPNQIEFTMLDGGRHLRRDRRPL